MIFREEESGPEEPVLWGDRNLGDGPFEDLLTDGLSPHDVVRYSKKFRDEIKVVPPAQDNQKTFLRRWRAAGHSTDLRLVETAAAEALEQGEIEIILRP